MKFHPSNLLQITLCFIVFILSYSCNKDSDLLTEYVIEKPQGILINDQIITMANSPVIIEPLKNDSFEEPEKVVVSEVTPPKMGTAEVQEDNTVVYTPDADETGTDEFDYTTTVTNPDETVTTQTGKITVTVNPANQNNPIDVELNADVAYWKNAFDKQWASGDSADAISRSKSANKNQEFYFLAYYIDGLTSIWQATGDNTYLDTALSLISASMQDAKSVGNNYLGWPTSDGTEYALWDSYYWRHVSTLLRIMHQSPKLRAIGNYQQTYEDMLSFSEKNIWDRYEADGAGNFYRVNTHMTSHWARIGMELYIITGKPKYKEVFDNISFGTMIGRPSNMRNQLYNNPKNPKAYSWSSSWGAAQGTRVQDCSHGGAIVCFIVNAYENNMYWNKADIDALVVSLDEVIFRDASTVATTNVDGSGGNDIAGRIHEWLTLGRFSQTLQNKIKNNYTGRNLSYFGIQPLGIMALNAKILSDGKGVYPEN